MWSLTLSRPGLLTALCGTLLAGLGFPAFAQDTRVLSDFENPAGWTAAPSDGVELTLHRDTGQVGSALRMDIDFQGHGGYAIIRRTSL